jgi:membrane-bound serine protease (ClpP class)
VILLIGLGLAFFVMPDGWQIPTIVAFGVLEFAETFLTWRWSQRGKVRVGPETLEGATGRAITECRPSGMVRVHAEDWRAECAAGVDAGARIRVVRRDQLTLVVEPLEQPVAPSPAPSATGGIT